MFFFEYSHSQVEREVAFRIVIRTCDGLRDVILRQEQVGDVDEDVGPLGIIDIRGAALDVVCLDVGGDTNGELRIQILEMPNHDADWHDIIT